jgi:DNA replication protein DnaC
MVTPFLADKRQQKLLALVQSDPAGSFAIFGPSGCGKSTIMSALFREAVFRHPANSFGYAQRRYVPGYTPVIYVNASELMDQIERFKYHDGPIPILTVRKIEAMIADEVFFTVIIDEFEKVRKTPFRMEESYNILNAIYKARGKCQFCIAGNLRKEDLEAANLYAEGTRRRIEALVTPAAGKARFLDLNPKIE